MISTQLQKLRGLRIRRQSRLQDERQTSKDRALALRLFNTFEHDLAQTDMRGLQFYVQHGTVTLYGIIRHEIDRELLSSVVRQMPGVKGVVDNLHVVDQRFQQPFA